MITTAATTSTSSSTPILDRMVPPPVDVRASAKRGTGSVIVAVVIVLLAAIWAFSMMQSISGRTGSERLTVPASKFIIKAIESDFSSAVPGLAVLWRVSSPFLAILLVVVIHELGHVLAGRLADFRLLSMRIGPLAISPPAHVKWRSKNPVPGAAGFVMLVPKHSRNLRGRAIVMLIGGPLANLATGLAWMLVRANIGWLSGWFIGFSIFVGIVNLLPFRRLTLETDGKRIFTLLFNSRRGERWLAILQLVTDLRNGVEPENLRPEFLNIATAVQDDSRDTVSAHMIAYSTAYHRHEDAEAARLLEVSLQYSGFAGSPLREAVFADAVGFQAKRRKRMDLAQQWLQELPEKTILPELRAVTEAALLEGQGNIEGALKKLEEAEKIIRSQVEPSRREFSLRRLQKSRAELLKQAAPVS